MSISAFFTKTLGANLANPRWSWGACNPQTNQLFLRVWEDELVTAGNEERSQLLGGNREYTSMGYSERQRHIQSLREGAEGYGVVCTAKDVGAATRSIKDFDHDELLKFGGIVEDGPNIYAQVVGRILVRDLARKRTGASAVIPDLKSIFNGQGSITEKEALATARVGQGAFRAQVLQRWGFQCCVTSSKTLDAIRASHIKPWRDSSNDERLDPNNGLPLIATLDALFDAGLISFAEDGTLLVSGRLPGAEHTKLGLVGQRLMSRPNKEMKTYLKYHRDSVFVA